MQSRRNESWWTVVSAASRRKTFQRINQRKGKNEDGKMLKMIKRYSKEDNMVWMLLNKGENSVWFGVTSGFY